MKIIIGSDHNGLGLKTALVEHLKSLGVECDDIGTYSQDPVDYPDVAERLAVDIAKGDHARGILICGTGIGMAIAANKVPGVRAAQAHDIYSVERSRKSNDAQVLTLGAQVIGPETAKLLVNAWIKSDFEGGRSAPKVEKINRIDSKYRR